MGREHRDVSQRPAISARQLAILILYPLVPVLIAVSVNFAVGVVAPTVALPTLETVGYLALSIFLLTANHTWLMTDTEIARSRYGLFATPEERAESDVRHDAPPDTTELQRSHASHRNLTENTVHFALAASAFVLLSPPEPLAALWLVGFGVTRLGHTFFFLAGNANWRGVFMTLSLVALYGVATYPLISLGMALF